MKVILWAPFGAGTHYWGPGTSAYRLYKILKDDNVKITLVHGSNSQELFPEVYDEQVKISSLDNKGKIASVIFLLKSFLWIRKNYHKYDAFHGITAFYFTFLPALYFNKFRGNTFIKITGGNGGFGNNSLVSKLLGFSKFRLSKANSISGYISISSYISANLIDSGIDKNKIFNIPNGVDTNRFKPVSINTKIQIRKRKNIPNRFTFTYIGGLTHNKRVINVIRSMKLLKDRGIENFQFLIVGPDRSNGVVQEEVKKLIYSLNLQDNVFHVEHTKEPEKYFQMSDVFILVSEMEGMSNSLLEAMACGLPTIVTKVSGSEDLVKEEVNGVFTNGSPIDIARCMEGYILGDFDIEKFSHNSRTEIINCYSSKFIMSQHIRLFSNEC